MVVRPDPLSLTRLKPLLQFILARSPTATTREIVRCPDLLRQGRAPRSLLAVRLPEACKRWCRIGGVSSFAS